MAAIGWHTRNKYITTTSAIYRACGAGTLINPNNVFYPLASRFFDFLPAKKNRDLGYTCCAFSCLITRLRVARRDFVARQSFFND